MMALESTGMMTRSPEEDPAAVLTLGGTVTQKSFYGQTPTGVYPESVFAGQLQRSFNLRVFFPLLLLALVVSFFPSAARSQTTATISGAVQDSSGAVIPDAQVTLTNEATNESRKVESNGVGLYAFPSLVPGTYSLKATARGFKSRQVTGIVLNAGDTRTVAALNLTVGTETQTITVSADQQMIPVENGSKVDVLSAADIDNLALEGQDSTELLKVLPGATTMSGGLTQTSASYSDLNITVQQSSIGMGININGAVNRSGTALLSDGANIIDVGDNASSLSIIVPDFTAQVTVQASNFGADIPFGPVVVSAISKSGGANYHGEGFFNARNSVLNANDWQDNNHTPKIPQGAQHYYYPGGSAGGPVPFTHKKLLIWGGYERWLQNQGNANHLSSFIPTAAMMGGDFSMSGAGNSTLCPKGFFQGTPPGGYPGGNWCSDLGGTVLANGGLYSPALPTPAATGTYVSGTTTYTTDAGQKFPSGFLDPGSAALAKIWPAANSDPATTSGGYNYFMPIPNINNGWVYRARLDYLFGENTKIYGSYQQAFNSDLASGNGAHLYWTPGNAIPYPGGGEQQRFFGKAMAGHIVHDFNSTTTADFMAAWSFGSFPFTEPDPSAAFKSTLGYPYGKVFSTIPSVNIPAYNSGGSETFPDFSQDAIFDNPLGQYKVVKESPQFSLTLTKLWGAHTIKVGGFTQTTDNDQSTFSSYLDGDISGFGGQNPDLLGLSTAGLPITGQIIGSPHNTVANFVAGIASGYSENDTAPIQDFAYMTTAAFVDDTWKATRRLTLDLGIRMEHVGHWYDRNKTGVAVFYPDRVLADYNDGKYAPGYYWHSIDGGVPLSGQPNRFAYPDPRFGVSYDVFGTGNTVVRGGWGVYRFVTQVNTVDSPLFTAQHVLSFGKPGGTMLQMQNIHNLAYTPCKTQCGSGGQWGLDPSDYGQPMSQAYNLTIDQRLPWNSQLEVAYVGNTTSQLPDAAEDYEGSVFSELANQNKTPVGAYFKPDPRTGILSTNPQNLGQNPNLGTMTNTATGNVAADYHPYGYAYGTNQAYMIQNIGYANYNGLQVSFVKTTGKLTFNLNGTWSKALATGLQEDPYKVSGNYGPAAIDRPLVFNASYTYSSGTLHTGNMAVNQLGGGWTISGISTWQAGGYIPSELGNGVPNFSLGMQYTGLPVDTTGASCYTNGVLNSPSTCSLSKDTGITSGIGDPAYFGTDEGIPIMPVLTCNPTNSLIKYQLLNGACFNAPAVGSQGGQAFPYMRATPYFNNDLAIYRTFHIYEKQQVQLRASAFDWLNHALPEFASLTPLTLNYNVDYASHAIKANYNQTNTGTNAFGVMTTKSQAPYQRIIELDVKYSF